MFDWLFTRKKFNLPPGPWSLPFIGTLRVFRAKFMYEEFAELTKEYGPILTVYLGRQMVIVLNDLESAKEALVNRSSDFSNRPDMVSGNLVSGNGHDIAFSSYSNQWKMLKESTKNGIRNYLEDDKKLENAVHQSVTKVLNLMAMEKGPFNPMKYIDVIMFCVMNYVCFGTCKDPDDPEFVKFMELVFYASNTVGNLTEDFFPFMLKIYESQNYKDHKAAIEKFSKIMEEKYKEHEATYKPDCMRDLIDCFIKEWKQPQNQNEGDAISICHIKNTLKNIFGGGILDPCRAMYFTIRFMAQFPDMQQKVQNELDNVVGKSKLPGLQDLKNLPRSKATLCECMRLGTSPCLGVPHRTRCDTKLGLYDIPKDTTVLVNTWYIHRNPLHWTNPLDFKPERFLTEDCPSNSLSSFSRGDRSCLGEPIAKKSLPLIFCCILQRFKLKLSEGSDPHLKYAGSHFLSQPEDFEIIVEERLT